MVIVRQLPRIFFGVFIGGVLGSFFTGDWAYSIVWACAIPAFILVGLVAGASRLGRFAGPGPALARVETIQRAGVETNGQQDCELRLVVVPTGGKPYFTTIRSVLATADLRLYSPGSIIAVKRLSEGKPAVTILKDPPPAMVQKLAAARSDPSLIPPTSDVPEWTASASTTRARNPQRNRLIGIVVIALAAAVTLIPAYRLIGWTASNIVALDFDGNNMIDGRHQQEAMEQLAAAAGCWQFTDINFYDSYIIVEGLTTPTATTTDDYMWRYGRATREGPDIIQPQDLSSELFDASRIDYSIIPGLVAQAKADARIESVESIYPSIRRDSFSGGQPVITISISGPYDSVQYHYTLDGTFIDKN
ncbi:MAG: hypothetical protein ABJB03_02190 [Rhodoglobus sp.]